MIKYVLLSVILTAPLLAQGGPKVAPSTPKTEEQLTTLEKAGLNTIIKEYQQVLQEFSQANIDIAKNHPGYHLDPKNPLSGVLVKDEKPDPKPVETKPVAPVK